MLETRSELDNLDALAGCPLLQLHPERYQAFLQVLVRCPSWLFTLFPTDTTTAWGAVAANCTNPLACLQYPPQDAPIMLAAASGVEAFQQRLVAVLFDAEPQLRAW